jgi:uncharacterized membrane protein
MGRALGILLGLTALWGCPGFGDLEPTADAGAPAFPTFDVDVGPIMELRCNLCHGEPADFDAPENLRLDVCEDTDSDFGAQGQAFRIVLRTVDQRPTPMPPEGYEMATPYEMAVLERWLEVGAPCSAEDAR